MQAIHNLYPKFFTIDKLDDELQCMALIRALPEEYRHLSSSLLLIDKLDKATILEAFRSNELNHQKTETANRARTSFGKGKVWPRRKITCYGCGEKGHVIARCPNKETWQKSPGDRTNGSKGVNYAEQKAEAVTEFAGKASAVSEDEAFSTSSDIFHWNTDTGATSHITPHRHWFCNYTPYRVPIRLADNRVIYSQGVGNIVFRPMINNQVVRDIEISRVLHVPALHNNLLAVLHLTQNKGFTVHILSEQMKFIHKEKVLFTATINKENVGYLDGFTVENSECVHMASTLPLNLTLWHRQLAHHNHSGIKKMIKEQMVDGLTLDSFTKPDIVYEPCLAGKMHANPFPSSDHRATEVLELVHSDLHYVGTPSHSGYKYWITFIDDLSRFKCVVPLKQKSDAFTAFKAFKAYAENQTGKTIKIFCNDKGSEYMSNEFKKFLQDNGIIVQHTVHNRPQQNGVSEHANQTLDEGITTMLAESQVSRKFWAECLTALVHILNRCDSSAVKGATPFEIWHKRKPDVSHLRVWGCLAYVHIQKDKRSSLGPHMEKCIFIGYPDGYKGWRFYNPKTKKVIISEWADFDERYTYHGAPFKIPETVLEEEGAPVEPSKGDTNSESIIIDMQEMPNNREDNISDSNKPVKEEKEETEENQPTSQSDIQESEAPPIEQPIPQDDESQLDSDNEEIDDTPLAIQ